MAREWWGVGLDKVCACVRVCVLVCIGLHMCVVPQEAEKTTEGRLAGDQT